jgi:hypothetical protein
MLKKSYTERVKTQPDSQEKNSDFKIFNNGYNRPQINNQSLSGAKSARYVSYEIKKNPEENYGGNFDP